VARPHRTINRSFDDINGIRTDAFGTNELIPGGDFAGFRYATKGEVRESITYTAVLRKRHGFGNVTAIQKVHPSHSRLVDSE